MDAYLLNLIVFIGIYGLLTMGLNLITGYTGLFALSHAAVYGVGAYVSALLAVHFGVPWLLAFLAAGLSGAAAGWLAGLPSLRLKGDYFAIATMGLAIIIESLERNWTDLTRGPLGIPGIPKPVIFGWAADSEAGYALLVIVVVALAYWAFWRLGASPFGRLLRATRDDEVAVQALGRNTVRVKLWALALGSFAAGLAGSLYAHYVTFIDPSSFTLLEVILMFSMLIVGGLESWLGALLGAAVVFLLPEALRFVDLPSSILGPARQMIYATLLIVIIRFRPEGFMGKYKFE